MYLTEAAERNYAQNQEIESDLSEALLDRHLPYVKRIVSRIAATIPAHVDTDDLINAGMIGLLSAVRRYDPMRANTFTAYAVARIKGAVLSELRSRDFLPRTIRHRRRELERAALAVERRLGREADDAELASEMGLDLQQIQEIRQASSLSFFSLDELGYEGIEDRDELLSGAFQEGSEDALALMGVRELQDALGDAIDELPEKERLVLSLYYWEELTMKEVGAVLGITESRVSQIHTLAVAKLRGKLSRRGHLQADWEAS